MEQDPNAVVELKTHSLPWAGLKSGLKTLFTSGIVNGLIGAVAGLAIAAIGVGVAYAAGNLAAVDLFAKGFGTAFSTLQPLLLYAAAGTGLFSAGMTAVAGANDGIREMRMKNDQNNYFASVAQTHANTVGPQAVMHAIEQTREPQGRTSALLDKIIAKGKSNPIEHAKSMMGVGEPGRA